MFLLISFVFLALGAAVPWGSGSSVLVALSIGSLLIGCIRERHVTAVGAFMFMSFLFFGMRPLHIFISGDTDLFSSIFSITATPEDLHSSMIWAAAGLWVFMVGVTVQRAFGRWDIKSLINESGLRAMHTRNRILSESVSTGALVVQGAALVVLIAISGSGREIYGSTLGAYAWDFPMVLQGFGLFGVAVAAESWRTHQTSRSRVRLMISLVFLLLTAWFAREVTLFRGAYITPIMAAAFGLMFRYRGRVSYIWLILPIVILLPFFRVLGETRTQGNDVAKAQLIDQMAEVLNPQSYWNFFDSKGDMNIFDTFVAATMYEPSYHPYILSWLYVPAHVIPRKIWPSKPEGGKLQDLSYLNDAPYSPGLIGFFWGDGGGGWMIASMGFLGFLMSWMDMKVLRMTPGYFKLCVYAILVVDGMYLTRFFLWQYTWQVFYFLAPCWFLARYVFKERGTGRVSGQMMPRPRMHGGGHQRWAGK